MSGKFALIIANTEYTDPGLAQLMAPGKDADEFARVLKSPDICAFDEVTVIFNETESRISETIDFFLSNRKPSDLLVLYFSGHGIRDEYGSLYLAVKNTNRARLRSTAVKSDFIRELMDQSRSKRQILILDCCNSGAFAQGTKAEVGGSVGTSSAFQGTGYGRVVLTASDSTQFAWEGDQIIGDTENSLFTNYLVRGLEGEADSNGDGCITVDELYDFAYEQIVNITPKQTPGKWSYKQQGDIILRNIRMEDTKPVPLPDDLVAAMNSSFPYIREGTVSQLELLLKGKNLSLARSARLALERMCAEDDSRRVSQAAAKALASTVGEKEEAQTSGTMAQVPSTSTGQPSREKIEQQVRFKAEEAKLQEKAAPERSEAQRATKDEVQGQPMPVKPRNKLFGIFGAAIFAIVIVGYLIIRSPLMSTAGGKPTETQTSTQEISQSTEAGPVIPVITKDSPTAVVPTDTAVPVTTEAPPATQPPTEDATASPSGPLPEITDKVGAVMVLVPEGEFMMGSQRGQADEQPGHVVYLDAFYIDKFEVTNSLYEACVNEGKCNPPIHSYFFSESPNRMYYGTPQYAGYPVIYVTWNMANTYCEWRGARLPKEAEWEKAARGTQALTYPWGKDLSCQKTNYQNCVTRTSAVDDYGDGVSPYGVYDMAGNVWEWVRDWYSNDYYLKSPYRNPSGPIDGQSKVMRGGSWTKFDVTTYHRNHYHPNYYNNDIGFRCARDINP